jgi:phosphoribosyl 1,2-cyclic phosphate phosphodiesterase
VLYTHYHADHLYGLDDLRQFPKHIGGPVPLYCADDVEDVIRQSFAYVFGADPFANTFAYLPKVEFKRIKPNEVFYVLGERVLPVELVHDRFRVLGFRIGNLAYCTDVNRIPELSQNHLKDLDVLILDALRYRPHPAHFGLAEALEMIEKLKPKQAYLTHLAHDLDHATVERETPDHVHVAHDGLTIEF